MKHLAPSHRPAMMGNYAVILSMSIQSSGSFAFSRYAFPKFGVR